MLHVLNTLINFNLLKLLLFCNVDHSRVGYGIIFVYFLVVFFVSSVPRATLRTLKTLNP